MSNIMFTSWVYCWLFVLNARFKAPGAQYTASKNTVSVSDVETSTLTGIVINIDSQNN